MATVLARAREKGADHEQLIQIGHDEQIGEFVVAGQFLKNYLDNLDFHSALDYPDLLRRAVIEAEAHRVELRERYAHVFVDEYQDTDPGQVALLQALAGDGRNLMAVGDPHQSIYGFRGAEVRGILDFPREFPTGTGEKAPVVVLPVTRRFGENLLRASSAVASGLATSGSIEADTMRRFGQPQAAPDSPTGRVEVLTFDTDRAEFEHIADLLRRAHLEDGVAWSRMAVLVRSGRATLAPLRRLLAAAGVPVEVASDETPLGSEPGVRAFLVAMSVVVDRSGSALSAQVAEELLLSPLAGLDATDVRAIGRALRRHDQALAGEQGRAPLASGDLVAQMLREPQLRGVLTSASLPQGARDGVERLVRLLERGRQQVAAGASAEEVLWELWAGTGRAQVLRAAVDRGGAAARRAHRDLDAMCALFDLAAKAEEQRGHTSAENFLAQVEAQQIPGDTLADRGVRGEGVQLLTAHRSKGLEWDLVVVAHVQEGAWPDLRRRASLLGADRLGAPRYGEVVLQRDIDARALLAAVSYTHLTLPTKRIV